MAKSKLKNKDVFIFSGTPEKNTFFNSSDHTPFCKEVGIFLLPSDVTSRIQSNDFMNISSVSCKY